VISCCDSRVQPKVFLENPINQAFTVQSIGNAIKNSEGSIDY
jgi:carbonic anhydrase